MHIAFWGWKRSETEPKYKFCFFQIWTTILLRTQQESAPVTLFSKNLQKISFADMFSVIIIITIIMLYFGVPLTLHVEKNKNLWALANLPQEGFNSP